MPHFRQHMERAIAALDAAIADAPSPRTRERLERARNDLNGELAAAISGGTGNGPPGDGG